MPNVMDDDNTARNLHLSGGELRCPINVAARRSGLSAHVIRAWERRYSAIKPDRTSKLRRLYSDYEVRRLVLLRQAVDLGHRIGEIARLPMDQLRALVGRDTVPGVEASPRIPLPAPRLIELAIDAVRLLQGAEFSQSLLQATRSLGVPDLFDDFVDVLLHSIAVQREHKHLRLAHERFAEAHLRCFLGDLLTSSNPAEGAGIVVSTANGQMHELPALMTAVTASRSGWDAIYAGPGLPAEELAFVVTQRDARALALGWVPSPGEPPIDEELRRLRALVGDDFPIFCNGARARAGEPAPRPATMRDFARSLGDFAKT